MRNIHIDYYFEEGGVPRLDGGKVPSVCRFCDVDATYHRYTHINIKHGYTIADRVESDKYMKEKRRVIRV